MPEISLGYIGLSVSNTEAWTRYGQDFLGLMQAEVGADGSTRFRLDDHAWRLSLHEDGKDDIAYLGFEVAGADELEMLRAALLDSGFTVDDATPELRATRGVIGLLTCTDPEGLAVELYYGPTLATHAPFASPLGVRFMTGEQGLGHVVLSTADLAAFRSFYLDGLGFRLSDTIRMALGPDFAIELEFYHGNPRHHTLAVAPLPVPMPKRTHHIMLQVETLDQVGHALDRAGAQGVRLTQSLGRHSNDQMVSFYCETPSGFELEYGWGALEVDSRTWRTARHDTISSWGHHRL